MYIIVDAGADPLTASAAGGVLMMVFLPQHLATGPKLSKCKKPMRRIVPVKRRM